MIWDIWVRLGHWCIVALVAFQLYSGENLDLREQHAWVGIAILSWVVFRIGWGMIGPRHARFSDFVASPRAVIQSLRRLIAKQHDPAIGHSAAGGVGILLLIGLLGLMGITGLVSTDDVFYDGPLNHWVSGAVAGIATEIHGLAKPALLLIVLAHVSAVLWHQFALKERLIQAMVHGRGSAVDHSITPAMTRRGAYLMLASVMLILGCLLWWGQF